MAGDWVNVPTAIRDFQLPPTRTESNRAFDWFQSLTTAALTLYFPPGIQTVLFEPGKALVLPRTVHLVFEPGATLQLRADSPSNLVLLTIEGHVDAGLHQIFDLFDPSGLRVGAGVAVHGQMVGPSSNQELYPQWWGAQTDPDNLAWNLPDRKAKPPIGLTGEEFGHVECVDSIATQLCLAASRRGQTVRFVGDYSLSTINLGKEDHKVLSVRALGDDLLLEGYGGTLEAPPIRPFPQRPAPLGPVSIPGTSVSLSAAGCERAILQKNAIKSGACSSSSASLRAVRAHRPEVAGQVTRPIAIVVGCFDYA